MSRSQALFLQANKWIPGGVNSPVRAFNGVGGDPLFIKSAHGAYLVDEDGQQYIDYVGSWGPMIAGHAHPKVIEAVSVALQQGLSFGAPCGLEITLAERICQLMPSIEKIRMVNSGTEATMSAIRLARGFTGRDKIIKFVGCYHGHADHLLVQAGSGGLTFNTPNSAGVPESFVQHTLLADFNNLDSVAKLFEQYPNEIAAIIVEPVAGNMNCVLPIDGFLQGLRDLCNQYASVLIFDEVMTGFRVAFGGAQALYNVVPDLTTLGKVIGGGMPVGAFGGKTEIMDCLAPLGSVYQAGTLSGNPVAMTAGIATLKILSADAHFYQNLSSATTQLLTGLQERANAMHIPFCTTGVGGMFGLYFTTAQVVTNFDEVKQSNVARFKQFFHLMLKEGVYFAPSAFEAGFISSAHGSDEINMTLDAAEKVFARLSIAEEVK